MDQWVEKNTALSRSKARALIQIYDAVVTSGVKWAKVQHLGWTKLNAIAGVLNGANADHWIEAASIRSRAEIKQFVQEHLGGFAGRKPEGSTAARVKTFKFRGDQIKMVQAAIDRAKNIAGVEDDSAALAVICEAYADGRTTLTPNSLVETLADYLSGLDADERANFGASVNARVTPSRRHGPAKGLFIGAEVVQPAVVEAEAVGNVLRHLLDAKPAPRDLAVVLQLLHDALGEVARGIAATQIAKHIGARVIGTASAAKHGELRALGVDHLIDYRTEDFEARARQITGGHGVRTHPRRHRRGFAEEGL